jgi:hypothetical protein
VPAAAKAPAAAPAGPVPIVNASFEDIKGARPVGWTLAPGSGATVSVGVAHDQGFRSLRLENPAGGAESTVVSEPVKLQVGKQYRLRAWIRTKGVRPDPASRYPTALGACVSMKSFPFTSASPTVAGDGFRRVTVTFFATTANDSIQLHLGRNGKSEGIAWFDGLSLEQVDDIGAIIPLETVKWAGKGFRYDDGGWAILHIEGEPYERGTQYGELVSGELARFVDKLAILQDRADPVKGWDRHRSLADAVMLRKFEPEFLEEMKGIADGAAKAGAKFRGRDLDLLDIVAINSDIDLGEMAAATRVTATPLTGRSFLKAEEEIPKADKVDRCSAFIATKTASADGRLVTGQMFMWPPGFTGMDWNVMVDVQPAKGHRFIMQTFPGGISSGTDWYINDAGIIIGETTVAQTPYDPDGTPEANRVRKAAQYATSIDEVATILKTKNNGLYTNDWTVADTKTDEGAVFLLGTKQTRMWRTGSKGHPADTPGGLKDFLWADNNNREIEVRKELIPNLDNNPVDLAFSPANRDLAFQEVYKRYGQGKFDLAAGVALQATSPINRPHACDGKLTTSEMAEKLMFVAHYGKTTLREKWVGSRYLADLPGAVPHLTLGYTTFNPVFVAEQLKAAHAAAAPGPAPAPAPKPDLAAVKESLAFPKRLLWSNTVFPATEGDNWFVSGSAAYHALLRRLPEAPDKAAETLRDALAELSARYTYLVSREGTLAPAKARTAYDRYGAYQIPRIKGTFLLHQLRLLLGNAAFSKTMKAVHDGFSSRPMTTEAFIAEASKAAGRNLAPFIRQWLDRDDLPAPAVTVSTAGTPEGCDVTVKVTQPGQPYHFVTSVELRGARTSRMERLELKEASGTFTFHVADKPRRVIFNAGRDLPTPLENPYTLPNLLDDFDHILYVYGTSREVEANHSLALNYRDQVADTFTEILPPLKADAEVTDEELASHDLVLFGGPEENGLLARMAEQEKLPVAFGKGFFTFRGRTYGSPEDGLALALPNPYNPKRTVYLLTANSRLELWHMTRTYQRGQPGWVVFKGPDTPEKGFHGEERFDLPVE